MAPRMATIQPEDKDKVSGLQAVALALKQFEFDSDKRLLIAGHADTSGGAKMNFELSALRAQNVHCLLEGSRYDWAEVSEKRHRIEDYQQILMYVKDRWSWSDCDPVLIDDKWSDDVDKAIRAFIKRYNDWRNSRREPVRMSYPLPEAIADKIKKDPKHKWPLEMWFAVYDIYNDDIAAALGVDRTQLNYGIPFAAGILRLATRSTLPAVNPIRLTTPKRTTTALRSIVGSNCSSSIRKMSRQ